MVASEVDECQFPDSFQTEKLPRHANDESPRPRTVIQLGRRLGRDLVEHTPDWGTMTADDFDAWTKRTLSGERLYFYGNAPAADR